MYIFNDFAIYLFYLVFFVVSYFSLERVFNFTINKGISLSMRVEEIIRGFILGLISILLQFFTSGINDSFVVPLFAISSFLLIIVKSYISSITVILVGWPYYVFVSDQTFNLLLLFSSILIWLIVSIIIIEFAPTKFKNLILFLTAQPAGVTAFLLSMLWITYGNALISIKIYLELYLFFGITIPIFMYFVNLSISSGVLFETSNFSFLNYYRSKMAISALNKFLYDNKISKGYLVIFEFENIKNVDSNNLLGVKKAAYEKIQNRLDERGILFTVDKKMAGLFYPLSSEYKDYKADNYELDNIRKILDFENIKIMWDPNKKSSTLNTKYGISIYGVDDSSIQSLIEYSTYALQDFEDGTTMFFNWKKYKNDIAENILFNEMDKILHLDNYKNFYSPIYDVRAKKQWGTYSQVDNISEQNMHESVDEVIYTRGWHELYNRFYGADAILNSKETLVIDLTITIFQDNFKQNKLLNFLKNNNIHNRKIYVMVKDISYEYVKDWEQVNRAINYLNTKSIKFFIPYNARWLKKISDKNIKNNYLAIDGTKIVSDFRTRKNLLAYNIINENNMIYYLERGVPYVSGPLISQKVIYENIDKKSKIYIDNLIRSYYEHNK